MGMAFGWVTVRRASLVLPRLDLALFVVALVLSSPATGSASPLSWSAPRLADGARPFGHAIPINGVACPSVSLCVAVAGRGDVITSTNPGGPPSGWTVTNVDSGNEVNGIACPSVSLCVAYDSDGNILSSTTSAGGVGAWRIAANTGAFGAFRGGLSCPSVSLCVAIGANGTVYTSTDPAADANTWTRTAVDPGKNLAGITCPSASLCVAWDDSGDVVSSADPGGGPGAWSVANLFPALLPVGTFSAISCPSAALCVAADSTGFLTSTNPTGGTAAWQESQTTIHGATDVVCPSTTLCLAPLQSGGSQRGGFAVSTNPTGGPAAWSVERPDANGIDTLACPSASLCLAFDDSGSVTGSTNPAGGDSAWTKPVILATPVCVPNTCNTGMQAVACPSASLCVIADDFGHLFSSVDPTDGNSWLPEMTLAANRVSSLACASPSLCVGLDDAGRLLTSTDPTRANSRWQVSRVRVDLAPSFPGVFDGAIECAGRTVCVAWDDSLFAPGPTLVTSTNPAGGSGTWKPAELFTRRTFAEYSAMGGLTGFSGIVCPSESLCVAATGSGILVSTKPASRHLPWKLFVVAAANLTTVSCPSTKLCLFGTIDGDIVSVRHPGDPGSPFRWHYASVDSAARDFDVGLTQLACPSSRLCVALDGLGNVFTSTDPTGGARTWHRAHVPYTSPSQFGVGVSSVGAAGPAATVIACASSRLCIISDGHGNLFTSTRPAAGAGSWKRTLVDPGSFVTSLSCPSRSTCIAGDNDGNVIVGRARAASPRALPSPQRGGDGRVMFGLAERARALRRARAAMDLRW